MNTSILFIIFNRPETTRLVFESIRQIQPSKLFIAADGPRSGNSDDNKLCDLTRKIVLNIDWPCEVKTLFREKNLGCKLAVSSAITWFFEHVDEGIILEDDCLPDPTFFHFCTTMLEKYRHNENILHINGTNSQFGEKFGTYSYYFSHCPQVWGWATWKRAWKNYDIHMSHLNEFITSQKAYQLFKDKHVSNFWDSLFTHMKRNNIDTWDSQWAFSVMSLGGLVITPNINLVQNIGFTHQATHTNTNNKKLQQKSSQLNHITHPNKIYLEPLADIQLFKKVYHRSMFDIMRSVLRKLVRNKH